MRSPLPFLSALLLLAGCTATTQAPPPQRAARQAAPPATPRARPAPPHARPTASPHARPAGRVVVLTVPHRQLRAIGPYVVYEPGRSVKRATYHTWRFPEQELTPLLDQKHLASAKLKVREVRVTRLHRAPASPGAPAPAGGFTLVVHEARLLGILERRLTLTVRPKKLRRQGAVLVYVPHAGVKRARYVRYHLDAPSFAKVVGSRRPGRDVTLRLSCTRTTRERSPQGPAPTASPEGGILTVTHFCTILGRARR